MNPALHRVRHEMGASICRLLVPVIETRAPANSAAACHTFTGWNHNGHLFGLSRERDDLTAALTGEGCRALIESRRTQ